MKYIKKLGYVILFLILLMVIRQIVILLSPTPRMGGLVLPDGHDEISLIGEWMDFSVRDAKHMTLQINRDNTYELDVCDILKGTYTSDSETITLATPISIDPTNTPCSRNFLELQKNISGKPWRYTLTGERRGGDPKGILDVSIKFVTGIGGEFEIIEMSK